MEIDILIDKLTPCLERVSTGEVLPTVFSLAEDKELANLQEKGWLFDWQIENSFKERLIYKLLLKDNEEIQGLLSAEIMKGLVFIRLVESAPHNLGKNKEYSGVGGHLFAIAIKLSLSLGFGGYVCMEAKNEELVKHYQDKLGANRVYTRSHYYRMEIDELNAQEILEKYTLEGDLNVK